MTARPDNLAYEKLVALPRSAIKGRLVRELMRDPAYEAVGRGSRGPGPARQEPANVAKWRNTDISAAPAGGLPYAA